MFDERLIRLAEMQHAEYIAAAARERRITAALNARRPRPSWARHRDRLRGRLGNGFVALGCRLLIPASPPHTRCAQCR